MIIIQTNRIRREGMPFDQVPHDAEKKRLVSKRGPSESCVWLFARNNKDAPYPQDHHGFSLGTPPPPPPENGELARPDL